MTKYRCKETETVLKIIFPMNIFIYKKYILTLCLHFIVYIYILYISIYNYILIYF